MSEGRNILLVEDDDDLRGMFRAALTFAGFKVRDAIDGLDALKALGRGPTDLVVLDLGLPEIHGLTVLQSIRTLDNNLPVVVVTGSVAELSSLAVECVLRKPVLPEKLVDTVNECLGKRP
jgi:DNA-binding response OmpR family regulator